jgi:hypothetical protein
MWNQLFVAAASMDQQIDLSREFQSPYFSAILPAS